MLLHSNLLCTDRSLQGRTLNGAIGNVRLSRSVTIGKPTTVVLTTHVATIAQLKMAFSPRADSRHHIGGWLNETVLLFILPN